MRKILNKVLVMETEKNGGLGFGGKNRLPDPKRVTVSGLRGNCHQKPCLAWHPTASNAASSIFAVQQSHLHLSKKLQDSDVWSPHAPTGYLGWKTSRRVCGHAGLRWWQGSAEWRGVAEWQGRGLAEWQDFSHRHWKLANHLALLHIHSEHFRHTGTYM